MERESVRGEPDGGCRRVSLESEEVGRQQTPQAKAASQGPAADGPGQPASRPAAAAAAEPATSGVPARTQAKNSTFAARALHAQVIEPNRSLRRGRVP